MERKEHLHLWCHEPGVYNALPGLEGKSEVTPEEAAGYLDIENILMVSYGGSPKPPFAPWQRRFSRFRSVIWSIVGDCSSKCDNVEGYVDEVLALHEEFPNVTGGILDDFFDPGRTFDVERISAKMRRARLPLWVVLYDQQLEQPGVMERLEWCDAITFWTWKAGNLATMEDNLEMLRERFPGKRLAAGLYLWNFGDDMRLSRHHLRYQCDVALERLDNGSLDDIILLGSPLVGMGLPSIAWAKSWIAANF